MNNTTTLRVLAALALTLSLAGCGGSGEDSAASSEAGGSSAESASVTIADLAYSPTEISVAAGSEITWTNDDKAPHTVTFDDEGVDSSEELKTGDTFSTTFDEAGTYAYTCAIHPDMKATVTVQ